MAPTQCLEPRRPLKFLLMNKWINLIRDVHWTPGMANQHFRSSGQIPRGSVEKSMSSEVRDAWVKMLALPFISFVTSGKWLHFLGCTFLVYKMDIVQCQVIVRLKERKHLLSTRHPVDMRVIVTFAFMWDMAVLSQWQKPVNCPDQWGKWDPLYSGGQKDFLRYWDSAWTQRKGFRFGGTESSHPAPHSSFMALLDFSASGIFRYV